MHVGWLPVLPIGLVVADGLVVGQLGSNIKTFTFHNLTHEKSLERLRAERPFAPEAGVRRRRAGGPSPALRPELLGLISYPLLNVESDRLMSIAPLDPAGGLPHLVLPCPEVMRVMYAPHSSLACALLDGPWERTRRGVLDVDETRVTPDGWRVATLQPLREEHVAVAGNLCLNPVAARKANLIRSAVVERQERPAFIEAGLPFAWTTLELRVAAFPLTPDGQRWFSYEIIGIGWSDPPLGPPPVIEWLPMPARPRGANGEPAGDPEGPSSPVSEPPAGSSPDVTSVFDPGPGPPTHVVEPGAGWLNRPRIIRIPPERLPPGPPPRPPAGSVGTDALSAGADARGPTGAGKAVPQAVDAFGGPQPASAPFGAVLAMLDGLAAARSIVAHEPVEPLPRSLVPRGNLACWAFPAVPVLKEAVDDHAEHWYVRDFRVPGFSTPRVRRAALVRRIVHADGVAYLLEIEPRPRLATSEGFRSLVFAPANGVHLHAVVERLLVAAAERAGAWPTPSSLSDLLIIDGTPGLAAYGTWRHRWESDEDLGGVRSILNGAAAWQAIKVVLATAAA